jgi:hypothetical protein
MHARPDEQNVHHHRVDLWLDEELVAAGRVEALEVLLDL